MTDNRLRNRMQSQIYEETLKLEMSTTRMADKIYMLDDGEIIEQGNHAELMKLNGKYAEMFRMQAEKYLIK